MGRSNIEILKERVAARDALPGPRVGDYVKIGDKYDRFTYRWPEDTLMQAGGSPSGSYYLGNSGSLNYSGGLNHGYEIDFLQLTDEVKMGEIWFFGEGIVGPHRGVYFDIECRVFKLKSDKEETGE